MFILSHRGIGFGYPENSLKSFNEALQCGFGIEFDVRWAGNKTVISHNAICDDKSSSDLPKVGSVLELLSRYATTASAVHIKETDNLDLLRNLGKQVHMNNMWEKLLFFDFTISSAQYFKNLFPNAKIAFSVGEKKYSKTVYFLDEIINIPFTNAVWWDEWKVRGSVFNKSQLDKIRNKGKSIYAVSPELHAAEGHPQSKNPKPMWDTFIHWGVDGICTDYPLELKMRYQNI